MLKTPTEIVQLRAAGQLVAETYRHIEPYIRPGAQTLELDQLAEEFIRGKGARPMYKGYAPRGHQPFPGSICVAINNVVVHGIPRPGQKLHEGDIVGIDIGVLLQGWIGDACRTYAIGSIDEQSRRLMTVTEQCLALGIAHAKPGNRIGDIGAVIQQHAEAAGFSVVRGLCGHGVGRALWEEPSVPHYGRRGTGYRLREGMVFTIEPMINAGSPDVRVEPDGWTISTADGSRSAQFEHTIALTDRGTEILTALHG